MAFLNRHSITLAFVLLVTAFVLALGKVQHDQAHRAGEARAQLYENTVAACERGNIIRQVVFANTTQAAKAEPGRTYSEQLKLLRAYPHINQQDGTLDCRAAIPEPE